MLEVKVEMMKNKVRRKHINWFREMLNLKNPEIEHHFILLQARLVRGRCLSKNRCAYYALKSYYSTSTVDELLGMIDNELH